MKSGEEVEIRERGVPVAILSPTRPSSTVEFVAPGKDPGLLTKLHFSAHLKSGVDAVDIPLEDRKKR